MPVRANKWLAWLAWLAGSMVSSLSAPVAHAHPPQHDERSAAMRLHLELVVNDRANGSVVPVTMQGGDFVIAARFLHAAGIDRGWSPETLVNLSRQDGIETVYSEPDQRLHLIVPSDWLPVQRIGKGSRRPRLEPGSDLGALINYDLYVSDGYGGRNASLGSELRLFGGFGAIRNTGSYRLAAPSNPTGPRYIRYDTSWTYIDDRAIRTYEAGDFVTRTLPWTNPARLGGVQVSRDFTVRPDIITYPLPALAGSAAVPSALDLYLDGYRTMSTSVDPGPFVLNELPHVNGAGEAVIVTTDAQGRQVQTSVPFYVANTLLRPGLSDYAFAIGKLRKSYGVSSFSYGNWVGTVSGRLGLTDMLTVEATAEAAPNHRLIGAGAVMRIGNLGVVEGSASASRQYGRSGRQFTAGYQYSGRHFNLMARAVFRSNAFADLSTYESGYYRLPTRQLQAHVNAVLGERLGTAAIGYVETRRDDDIFRLATFSYYRRLFGRSSLNLSVSQDFERKRMTAMAHIVIPFGRRRSAVAGVDWSEKGNTRLKLNASQTVSSDGGLGWSAGLSHGAGEPDRYRADLTWRTPAMQVHGGFYGSRGNTTTWGSATGSVVLMDGGAFLANRIHDAFALVSTDGHEGIPVRYENQKIGTTNRNGHLLIASVPSYYAAKFEIDATDLPAEARIPLSEQRAAVRNGSGRLLRFPIERSISAYIDLRDEKGDALPAGTQVSDGQGYETWVGLDGAVYMENLQGMNRLTVIRTDGAYCTVEFPYQALDEGIGRVGPVFCR
ncbi:fimbria/pilus outer membrane usher protein [Sphingopyxis granuli]|uniref:fimbria/pilus outer membrane usher protein n=1 Tax=Sphingopyxis granuli TaxID=267128 RepID=UPI001F52DC14|nr:fimbria/pilus outer membrane usher protein [Sphingopyxis granuli]UNK79783.1 fimbria/pilus outer membrane usher protein [Sphingopyxis granuli]